MPADTTALVSASAAPLTVAVTALLSAADVAAALEVDKSTVTRWAATGHLPHAAKAPGLRGAYLFTQAAVDTFTAGRAGGRA